MKAARCMDLVEPHCLAPARDLRDDRAGRHMDEPVEAVRDEMRDEPAVVQVRVRKKQRVDLARVVREREAVAYGLVRTPLDHPAIDEHPRVACVEDVLRAGDCGRAPRKESCMRGYSG